MTVGREYVTEIAALFPPRGEWTEADYFNLPETMRTVELVSGEVIVHPPLSILHQRIVGNLYNAVRAHAQRHGLGEVFVSPVGVRLAEGKIREPDVVFVRHEHADRVGELTISGAPDWVAEVISPSSRQSDQVDKLQEYAEAGIPEYWLVDPDARTVSVYQLVQDEYRLVATYAIGQTVRSVTIENLDLAAVDLLGGEGSPR